MANTKTFRGSFVGGELSPEMFGRIDDSKFQNGAASLQNMIATSLGPAEKRPGFAYVATTKNNGSARLIPFTYSTTQTVVIEIGAGYFRFHTQGQTVLSGGVPYEVANPYTAQDLFAIHYVQSADVLTLVHPNYPPAELRRLGAADWEYAAIEFGQTLPAPTGVTVTPTLGYKAVFASVSSGTGGQALFTTEANHTLALGDGVYIIPPTGSGGLSGFYLVSLVPSDGSGNLINNELYLMDYSGNPVMYGAAATATVGGTVQYGTQIVDITNTYVVSAVAADGIQQSPTSTPVSALNNLYVTGSYNTLTWDAVPGAANYYVFKQKFGLYGFIGQTSATTLTFSDTNIAVDMSITPDINDPEFGSADNYPGAVGYCQQRRVFAGTNDQPQNLWMTKTGTESDLSYSLPVKDSDRIAIAIAAREQSTILHILPLLELILLTSSCEISASPSAGAVITPSTISANPQSYVGATQVQPTIVNNQALFCAARGGHVRELGYQWQIGGYVTGDVSLRAAHLFDGLSIVDQAFMKAPWQAVWFVSSNGNLLGFTYIPEEGVGAWHHHVTDGQFQSVAVVAEGAEDHLYAIITRQVNGQSVNFIERMSSRIYGEPANPYAPERAFYVDCGASFDGTNTSATTMTVTGGTTWGPEDTLTLYASYAAFVASDPGSVVVLTGADGETLYRFTVKEYLSATAVVGVIDKVLEADLQSTATATWAWARPIIEGLTWLVGKTVNVLVDGAVQPACVVRADGSITLQRPGVVVQAGLPYTAEIDTLPITLQVPGMGQGTQKNVNKVWLKLYKSGSIFAGPTGGAAAEFKQRTTEAYGSPPDLMTKEIELAIPPSWAPDGRVSIAQSNPLPLTVVGVTAEVSVGG